MILLGNTYPLSLIRRPVRIMPVSLGELRQRVREEGFLSFWGHDNTRAVAADILGFDPAPVVPRPALVLDSDGLPCLAGKIFQDAWVLSPDYAFGFRPQIGLEVTPEQIVGWQVLRISYPNSIKI